MFVLAKIIDNVGNYSAYFGKFLWCQTLKVDFYVTVNLRPLSTRTPRYLGYMGLVPTVNVEV